MTSAPIKKTASQRISTDNGNQIEIVLNSLCNQSVCVVNNYSKMSHSDINNWKKTLTNRIGRYIGEGEDQQRKSGRQSKSRLVVYITCNPYPLRIVRILPAQK